METPFYVGNNQNVFHGESLPVLSGIDDATYHSCVTDPPYGLSAQPYEDVWDCLDAWLNGKPYLHDRKGFDGHSWDGWVPGPEIWKQVYRVLKPGAYLFAFTGTRTLDLMGIAIRLAGFEMRDTVMWVYNKPGFSKTGELGRDVDAELGVKSQVVRMTRMAPVGNYIKAGKDSSQFKARRYEQTEAKSEKAKEWSGWATALSPCFEPVIVARKPFKGTVAANLLKNEAGALNLRKCMASSDVGLFGKADGFYLPGNILVDEEAAAQIDKEAGEKVSRFFCCAKPTKEEKGVFNLHPTVKPVALMQYLVRLSCAKGRRVLDPFVGSGTTLVACAAEGMCGDGIERDVESCATAKARLEHAALPPETKDVYHVDHAEKKEGTLV